MRRYRVMVFIRIVLSSTEIIARSLAAKTNKITRLRPFAKRDNKIEHTRTHLSENTYKFLTRSLYICDLELIWD